MFMLPPTKMKKKIMQHSKKQQTRVQTLYSKNYLSYFQKLPERTTNFN